MGREVLASLETDAKNRPSVPWYNLKGVFKAFLQVWGGALISLQMIINL